MAVTTKTAVFWEVTPCSLVSSVPMFHMVLLPPSQAQSKMEATGTPDILLHIYQTTWCHLPKGSTLHNYKCFILYNSLTKVIYVFHSPWVDKETHFRKSKDCFWLSYSYTAKQVADPHCHKIFRHIRHVLKFLNKNIFRLYCDTITGVSKSAVLWHQAMKM